MRTKCPKCDQKYEAEDECAGQHMECSRCRCLFVLDSRSRDLFPLPEAMELAKRISDAEYSGRVSQGSADLARNLLNLPPRGIIPGSLSDKINNGVPFRYTVKNGEAWRGKGICITSDDSFCYKRMAELLAVIGAVLKKAVSKQCNLLIKESAGERYDLEDKARELGVPIVNIETFSRMISLSPGVEALFMPDSTDWIRRDAVITGFSPEDKFALIKLLDRFSVIVRETVKPEINALIIGPDADPKKISRANDMGVRVIDVDTLISELNER